jgi:hypothetical protein
VIFCLYKKIDRIGSSSSYECSDRLSDKSAVFVGTAPAFRTRGGGIFPIEGNRWLVSLGGALAIIPPQMKQVL